MAPQRQNDHAQRRLTAFRERMKHSTNEKTKKSTKMLTALATMLSPVGGDRRSIDDTILTVAGSGTCRVFVHNIVAVILYFAAVMIRCHHLLHSQVHSASRYTHEYDDDSLNVGLFIGTLTSVSSSSSSCSILASSAPPPSYMGRYVLYSPSSFLLVGYECLYSH